MPASALDKQTALIVVDLQKGVVGLPLVTPAKDVIERSAKLAAAFRRHDLPVFLVNAAGTPPGRTQFGGGEGMSPPPDWTELVPELDRQPSDFTITKLQWGAFYGTPLDLHLHRLGVTQVVLTGIATSVGVESTARAAYDHGYNVTVAIDAVTDLIKEGHDHTVQYVFPALGETGTTEEITGLLDAR